MSPWTVTISDGSRDIGRLVGFEGSGATIIGMHGLKPDAAAVRACELTVYRMGELLVESKLDAAVFAALERWLLKRGWRGNIVKKPSHHIRGDGATCAPILARSGFRVDPSAGG